MKIKYLAGFFWVAICISNAYSATIIEDIVALAKTDQHTFCRKGIGSIILSIRSDNGGRCQTTVGASIARMVCDDFEGFKGSQCAKNANLVSIDSAEKANLTLEQLVLNKTITYERICEIITEILPSKAIDCAAFARKPITSVTKPAPPAPSAEESEQKMVEYLLNLPPVAMDAKKVKDWPGLANLGNTCFMNSSLKFMARQKELLNMLNKQVGEDTKTAELRKAFKGVINMIRLGKESPANKDNRISERMVNNLRESMKKIDGIRDLTDCDQHDANEFLQGISGILDFKKDTPNNKTATLLIALKEKNKLSNARFSAPEPYSGFFSANSDSSVQDLIKGFLDEQVTDEKNPIRLPDGSGSFSHVQKTYFSGLDKSLIIPIQTQMENRIRTNIVKTDEVIEIGHLEKDISNHEQLDKINGLTYQTTDFKKAIPKNYPKRFNLIAVVVRGGGDSGGHYWTYIKDENEGWIEHNDNKVSVFKAKGQPLGKIEKRSASNRIDPQVYMYLYEEAPSLTGI